MVSIGRGGRGPLINRPTNVGRAGAANARLDHIAAAHAARYTAALAVDGTAVYFWHKNPGSIACSCSAAPQTDPYHNIDVQELDDDFNTHGSSSIGDVNEASQSRWYPSQRRTPSINDFLYEPPRQTVPEKLNTAVQPTATGFEFDEAADDLDSALARTEPGQPVGGGAADDPFSLFSGRLIECPVCLGTGYLDSWQLVNGARVIFDTSPEHSFECFATSVDDSRNPTALRFEQPHACATWTYRVPLTWSHVVRVAVYNGNTRIDPTAYTWTWTAADGTSGVVGPTGLNPLRGRGGPVTMILVAADSFEWTHAELCLSYAPPLYAQFPEIDQVYEEDFLDWNTTLQLELPLLEILSEGDYLCDGRYNKVWKLNRITAKRTSNRTLFSLTADARGLHTLERLVNQLNLFSGPLMPRPLPLDTVSPTLPPAPSEDPVWEDIQW